ncbi:helix-turn-helix domain-containing protein [Flavobacterium sp. RHBU_3]|uniref:helix-turn-helix domain-containing protein n=1 Tax=Flavobacterium sp. RHBU_3 TaxID=3391184 RepID=UPI00398549A1
MITINSITEFHRLVGLADPLHPLISIFKVSDMQFENTEIWRQFSFNFYCISLKKGVESKVKYGRQYYDYDKGVMTFIAPRQVQSLDIPHNEILSNIAGDGYTLLIHPDLLYTYPLAENIRHYGFFAYEVNEALHLSEKEERYIVDIFDKISEECIHIDRTTQDIIIAQTELLLNYSKRFYERQFITRKPVNHDMVAKLERILNHYFDSEDVINDGLPTVEFLAEKLCLSPHYLSDMLRTQTGKNAQQHIQDKIVEKAKEYLTLTSMSVSEIAYKLGFGYPQSFNKMFKRNVSLSPLEFRQSFN